ncbi:hypothetical protein OE88DRAFT_18160 [Heliocybe sulcata]|uniref:CBM21 domain-containing protein n=1 Tax=Heliocybe sulcata TaxID=5364 RepID=A0A5C3NRW8_9AGAM|nr:hypothetical protein OE88DRAFT_18160 [Heliocybe sulcata]
MVYSTPDSSPAFRPQHRRTRSSGATFSNERTDGAFVSLGSLPRRKAAPAKKFHFRAADDDDDDDVPPPLDQVTRKGSPAINSLGLSVDTENIPVRRPSPQPNTVAFPRASPRASPSGPPSPRPFSPRPSLMQRTPSSPVIMLSNGKPLKSSLKSSNSSPNIPAMHLRTQSAPSTPSVKSVHFGEDDEDEDDESKPPIEHVRLFKSTGRPANLLSFRPGEDTETETEVESSGYPFPAMPPSSSSHWEIDLTPSITSAIPQPSPSPYGNIYLETVALPKARPYTLRGSVLVRNLSFQKQVAVRFTLDDWQTTSEVTCKHVVSLPSLPPPFPRARTVGDAVGLIASHSTDDDSGAPQWDRFSFVVRLEDYEHRLNERTLFMVARYTAPGTGEWWDNNNGKNYRVGFKKVVDSPTKAPESPVINSSQQGSFRAPSTFKATPVSSTKSAGPAVSAALSLLNGGGKSSPLLTRTNSGPPSIIPGMLPYTAPPQTSQRRHSTSMKLKLANYAAPSVPSVGMASTSGMLSPIGSGTASPIGFGTPPKVPSPKEEREKEERIEDVEREWREEFYWDRRSVHDDEEKEENRKEKLEVRMVGEIVGGQFVSSVVPPPQAEEVPTPSMSSAESSPPDSGVSTPVGEESGMMTPRGTNGGMMKDSSYAAFVRQWCFAQGGREGAHGTPMPMPSANNGHGWLGVEGYGPGGFGDRVRCLGGLDVRSC